MKSKIGISTIIIFFLTYVALMISTMVSSAASDVIVTEVGYIYSSYWVTHADERFLYTVGITGFPDHSPVVRIQTVDDAADSMVVGTPTLPRGMRVEGMTTDNRTLYVAGSGPDLAIVDTTNPAESQVIGQLNVDDNESFDAKRIETLGNYVILSDELSVLVVDVADKSNPVVVGKVADSHNLASGGGIRDIEVAGQFLYVAAWENGVIIFDMSVPTNPTPVTDIPVWGAERVIVEGNTLFADGVNDDGLVLVDVSDPYTPEVKSRSGGNFGLVGVHRGVAFIGGYHDGAHPVTFHIVAVDARVPSEPQFDVARIPSTWNFTSDSRFIYGGDAKSGRVEVWQLTFTEPVSPPPSDSVPCPVSGRWPAGCVPTSPSSPNPNPAPPPIAGEPCPSSGRWPAGCVPVANPSSPPSAGQPCPPFGRWPQGCIP